MNLMLLLLKKFWDMLAIDRFPSWFFIRENETSPPFSIADKASNIDETVRSVKLFSMSVSFKILSGIRELNEPLNDSELLEFIL